MLALRGAMFGNISINMYSGAKNTHNWMMLKKIHIIKFQVFLIVME